MMHAFGAFLLFISIQLREYEYKFQVFVLIFISYFTFFSPFLAVAMLLPVADDASVLDLFKKTSSAIGLKFLLYGFRT